MGNEIKEDREMYSQNEVTQVIDQVNIINELNVNTQGFTEEKFKKHRDI